MYIGIVRSFSQFFVLISVLLLTSNPGFASDPSLAPKAKPLSLGKADCTIENPCDGIVSARVDLRARKLIVKTMMPFCARMRGHLASPMPSTSESVNGLVNPGQLSNGSNQHSDGARIRMPDIKVQLLTTDCAGTPKLAEQIVDLPPGDSGLVRFMYKRYIMEFDLAALPKRGSAGKDFKDLLVLDAEVYSKWTKNPPPNMRIDVTGTDEHDGTVDGSPGSVSR